ncbi:MAG: hypothetical protein JNK82_34845 [Myxococcaceae bacterium]|nr:hypothetical protein [Myxococcaceae bacterium]
MSELRQTVLLAAKRFKSSWVEMGKLLVEVRHKDAWKEWGHDSFDSYCFRELRLKKATVDKLTKSYSFLDKHEPKAMAQDDIAEVAPPFEVIEVLAGAEERGQLSTQEYRNIRDSIWNPEGSVSELKRELVDRFPRPEPEPPSDQAQLKRLAGLAKKLAEELNAFKKVPRAVAERAQALADDVAELVRPDAEA